MGPGQRAGGVRKGGPAGGGGAGRPATAAGAWAVSALCLLLSAGSAAACLLLGVQAAALQGRVAALEEERELLRRAEPPDALPAWVEPHLERLLREVRCRAWGGECLCSGRRLTAAGSPAGCGRASASGPSARGQQTRVPAPKGSCYLRSSLRVGLRENRARRAVSGTSRGRKRKDCGL